ncbi:hypothetical protein [Sporanaerobacter acetigenes]|uniref:Phosphotransferase enzyme family protein n=1 Tax=Sporanaerobacter acetigenes DSM 13106 TaxID=1123281 RepID=A0A1M5XDH2_9FIRM|nr:hypothetical protein [Sporanaerobacter acetigenes]SHH97870.1 hypothetical protein SAMN02745180_01658 [Sporanaerobacter acetigenes DSM 13106]
MNIIEEVYKELIKLGLLNTNHIDLEEIQNKDGIYLFRIAYENKHFVLKYFLNDEYAREIKNYSILEELNIPTIKVYARTDRALLLEDLKRSKKYRLGKESDLMNTEVAKVLATWYVDLHTKGAKYIYENGSNLYREFDVVTRENIDLIKNKSNTSDNRVWDLILDNYDLIFSKIGDLEETLTYNDFYWTNLAVGNDGKEAMMFDYNLLGVGFRYNDIRNVCSSLSEEAGKVFIEEYGAIDEEEKIIDDGISTLVTLIFAYRRPKFPNWAEESLNTIHSGELEKAIESILDL